jgi:hypothetical protein
MDRFYDESGVKGKQSGRICEAFLSDDALPQSTHRVNEERINGTKCGMTFCMNKLNEVCMSGTRCICRPGEGRIKSGDVCNKIDRTPLVIRVTNRGGKEPLFYRYS